MAHRPDDSAFSFLGKLEYRGDSVENAVAGEVGAAGQTALQVDGNAKMRRLIAGLAANWHPQDSETAKARTEISLFAGVRHNFDTVENFLLKGTSLLVGLDVRIGAGENFEVGGRSTIRHDNEAGTTSYAVGPEFGFVPADNMLVSIGYNFAGFRDPDFSEARFTNEGFFVSVRIKLDDDVIGLFGSRE